MAWPKWLYRKHPTLGHFDRTLVLSEKAEKELMEEPGATWSEDPAAHGFAVRPATLMHSSHVTPNHFEKPLHELTSTGEKVTEAAISTTDAGDIHA